MKISLVNELNGRFGIVAEAQGYDGALWLRELWLDRRPVAMHQDRIAVAATLAFGRKAANELTLESAISPGTAQAIKNFNSNLSLNVSPVDYNQKRFPEGSNALRVVGDDSSAALANSVEARREMSIRVLRSDRFAGSLMSMESLSISSNAFIFDVNAAEQGEKGFARLAVGVLFAEDLGADTIFYEGTAIPETVRDLLISCGLKTK